MKMTDEQALAVLDAFTRSAPPQVCCGNAVGHGTEDEAPSCCGFPLENADLIEARAHIAARLSEGTPTAAVESEPVARLLHWTGRHRRAQPDVCARMYSEFSKGEGEKPGGFWREGAPLYPHPPTASAGVTEARLRDLVEAAQGFELIEHADETWLVFRSSVEKGFGAGSVRLHGPMAKDARARFAILRAALSAAKGE
jgi:hypothetical protein